MKLTTKSVLAGIALLSTLSATKLNGQEREGQKTKTSLKTVPVDPGQNNFNIFRPYKRIESRFTQLNPVDRRLTDDPNLYADVLLVEKHLLNASVPQIRILDFVANSHPDIAQDFLAGVQLELSQDDIVAQSREWVAQGKKAKNFRIKIASEVLDRYLRSIEKVDPQRVEGTAIVKIKKDLANLPLGTVKYWNSYRNRELPNRLSLPHDEYKALYESDANARHELAAKTAIVRKAVSTGELDREYVGLFSYYPHIGPNRDKLKAIFENLSGEEALYEALPTYTEQEYARELRGALIEEIQQTIETFSQNPETSDLAFLIDQRFKETVGVLANDADLETRILAYQRLGNALLKANTEATYRNLSQVINQNKEFLGKEINIVKKSLTQMADEMGIIRESLAELKEDFTTFKSELPTIIKEVVQKELRQQNFSIAGYSFAGKADKTWAQSLNLTYESSRLVQGVAALSGDPIFARDAAQVEATVRNIVGITKGANQVSEALGKLEKAEKAAETAEQLEQMTSLVSGLTNIASAAASLVSLFSSTGPSADEIIIDMLRSLMEINQEILDRTYDLEANQMFLSQQMVFLQQAIEALANDNKEQAQAILQSSDYTQLLTRVYSEQIMQAMRIDKLDEITNPTIRTTNAFLADYEDGIVDENVNLNEPLADLASFLKTESDQALGLYPTISRERVANIDEFGGGGAFQTPYDMTVRDTPDLESVLDQFQYLTQLSVDRQQVLLPLLARQIKQIAESEGVDMSQFNIQAIENMQNPEAIKEIALTYLAAAPAMSAQQSQGDLGKVLEARLEEVVDANEQMRILIPIVYDLYIRRLADMRNHAEDFFHMYEAEYQPSMIFNPDDSAFLRVSVNNLKNRYLEKQIEDFRNELLASNNPEEIKKYYDSINKALQEIAGRKLVTDLYINNANPPFGNLLRIESSLERLSEMLQDPPKKWNEDGKNKWHSDVFILEKLAEDIGLAELIKHPKANEKIDWTKRSWRIKDKVPVREVYQEKKNFLDDWDWYARDKNVDIGFYSNKYVKATDLALKLLQLEVGQQKADNFKNPGGRNFWYRNWNGHESYSHNNKNGYVQGQDRISNDRVIGRINKFELATHNSIRQLREAINQLFIKTDKDAKTMWADMLLGKIDNPKQDIPDYLQYRLNKQKDPGQGLNNKNKERYQEAIPVDFEQTGTLTVKKIAALQARTQQTLQDLAVLKHALNVFINAGWDECVSFNPALYDLIQKIKNNQLPDYQWLVDPQKLTDMKTLYRSIDEVVDELRAIQADFDFISKNKSPDACDIGIGQPEALLKAVQQLNQYGQQALEAAKAGNKG